MAPSLSALFLLAYAPWSAPQSPLTIESPDGSVKLWYTTSVDEGLALLGIGNATEGLLFELNPISLWTARLATGVRSSGFTLYPTPATGLSNGAILEHHVDGYAPDANFTGTHSSTASSFTFTWSGVPTDLSGALDVTVTASAVNGTPGHVELSIDVAYDDTDGELYNVVFPRISFKERKVTGAPDWKQFLAVPRSSGVLFADPMRNPSINLDTDNQANSQYNPGTLGLQFVSYYNSAETNPPQFYIGTDDFQDVGTLNAGTDLKGVLLDRFEPPQHTGSEVLPLLYRLNRFTSKTPGVMTTEFHSEYPSRLAVLHGDWLAACKYYRSEVLDQAPHWVENGPMYADATFPEDLKRTAMFQIWSPSSCCGDEVPWTGCQGEQDMRPTELCPGEHTNVNDDSFPSWSDHIEEQRDRFLGGPEFDDAVLNGLLYLWDRDGSSFRAEGNTFAGFLGDWLPPEEQLVGNPATSIPDEILDVETKVPDYSFGIYFNVNFLATASQEYQGNGHYANNRVRNEFDQVPIDGSPMLVSADGACGNAAPTPVASDLPYVDLRNTGVDNYAILRWNSVRGHRNDPNHTDCLVKGMYLDGFSWKGPQRSYTSNADLQPGGGTIPFAGGGGRGWSEGKLAITNALHASGTPSHLEYLYSEGPMETYLSTIRVSYPSHLDLTPFKSVAFQRFIELSGSLVPSVLIVPMFQAVYHDYTLFTDINAPVIGIDQLLAADTNPSDPCDSFVGPRRDLSVNLYMGHAPYGGGSFSAYNNICVLESLSSDYSTYILQLTRAMAVYRHHRARDFTLLGERMTDPKVAPNGTDPLFTTITNTAFVPYLGTAYDPKLQPFVYAAAFVRDDEPDGCRLGVLLTNWDCSPHSIKLTIDPVKYGLAAGSYQLQEIDPATGNPVNLGPAITISTQPKTVIQVVQEVGCRFLRLQALP